MTNAVNPTTPTEAANGSKMDPKEPEQSYIGPVPTDVYTGKQFDKKVDINECSTNFLKNVDKKEYSCLGIKPLYMVTKQHLHDQRSDTRGIQLKFNTFTNFTTRYCTQRQKALHTLIKYVQGRSGYKNATTGKKFVNASLIVFCLSFLQHKPTQFHFTDVFFLFFFFLQTRLILL